jgi:PKD repeat protein
MKRLNQIVLTLGLFMSLVVLLVFTSCQEDAPAPTAIFSTSVDGFDVAFTNSSKDASTYSWNFGDGSTSTEANPTHTYSENDDYEVTLTAKGDGGENAMSQTVTIDVSPYINNWDITNSVQTATAWGYTAVTELDAANTASWAIYIFAGVTDAAATKCEMNLLEDGSVEINGTATDQCSWMEEDDGTISIEAKTFASVAITGEINDDGKLIITTGDMGLMNQFPDELIPEDAKQYKDVTNIDSWVFTSEVK